MKPCASIMPVWNSGLVIVDGTDGVDFISAIREAWAVNGVTKSFVELMGSSVNTTLQYMFSCLE